jgi:hypothetical protein
MKDERKKNRKKEKKEKETYLESLLLKANKLVKDEKRKRKTFLLPNFKADLKKEMEKIQ